MNRTSLPAAAVTPDRRGAAPARLRGGWLVAARVVWIAVVGLLVVSLVAALPLYYQAARTPRSPEAPLSMQQSDANIRLLQHWGLSLHVFAMYDTLTTAGFALAFIAAGCLLFWRRSDDRMVLFLALWFPIFGVAGSPLLDPLARAYPVWELPARYLQGVGLGCFPIFTYLFPDGRFVPRWTRYLTIAWVVWIVISPFTPFAVANFSGASWLWFGVLIPGSMAIGILAQIYRYIYISRRDERQQTKWVLFGLSGVATGIFIYSIVMTTLPGVGDLSLARLLYVFFTEAFLLVTPFFLLLVCIGVAILRYHLWDIDQIINRTLVYGTLTGALALVYVSSVVLLQQILRVLTGSGSNQLVVVISTLALATAFQPLRRRIQAGIDRRFYRRKYDMSRTLATFSVQLRNEVDLDMLTRDLVGVVEKTLQPAQVSLWLPERYASERRRQHDERQPRVLG